MGRGRKRRILSQDRPLELLQLGGGIDSKLLHERAASVLEGLECLGLAPDAVERKHQVPTQAFPIRMRSDERLELWYQRLVGAAREVGLDPALDRVQVELFEAGCLDHAERSGADVFERGAAPETERFREGLRRHQRLLALRALDEFLEALEIEFVRLNAQCIAVSAPLDPLRAQHFAQPVDRHLQRIRGRRWWSVAPDAFNQPVTRDRAIRVQEQTGKERPLSRAADGQDRTADRDLERPQQPELDVPPRSVGHLPKPAVIRRYAARPIDRCASERKGQLPTPLPRVPMTRSHVTWRRGRAPTNGKGSCESAVCCWCS